MEQEGIADATAFDMGVSHSCAVIADKRVRCWGTNWYGELGVADHDERGPVTVPGLENVDHVAAGGGNSCALVGGEVFCWGLTFTSSAVTTTVFSSTPQRIGDFVAAEEISLEGGVLCVRENSAVRCVGQGNLLGAGWLPDLVRTDKFYAGRGVEGAVGINVSERVVCAIVNGSEGRLRCWGRNENGNLGGGFTASANYAAPVDGTQDTLEVGAGQNLSCALVAEAGGRLKCWGLSAWELTEEAWTMGGITGTYMATVVATQAAVKTISVNDASYCAALVNGNVQCFGGFNFDHPVVSGVGHVEQLAGADDFQCARLANGTVKCWGEGYGPLFGNESLGDRWIPQTIAGLADVVDLAATPWAICAVTGGGALYCWGSNYNGLLGLPGNIERADAPTLVIAANVKKVALGVYHGCAALGARGAVCWGSNWQGRLGTGDTGNSTVLPTPVRVIKSASDVSATFLNSCFLDGEAVYCTGVNYAKGPADQFDTRSSWSAEPVAVSATGAVRGISARGAHTCASVELDDGVHAACWGWNDMGQVGFNPGWLPVEVKLGTGEIRAPLVMR